MLFGSSSPPFPSPPLPSPPTPPHSDVPGMANTGVFLLSSAAGGAVLLQVVQRSKKCWDFSFTSHFLHLLATWAYSGSFPSSFGWWGTFALGVVVMTVVGEQLCARAETENIEVRS